MTSSPGVPKVTTPGWAMTMVVPANTPGTGGAAQTVVTIDVSSGALHGEVAGFLPASPP